MFNQDIDICCNYLSYLLFKTNIGIQCVCKVGINQSKYFIKIRLKSLFLDLK